MDDTTAKFHATQLLSGLQTHVGDQSINDWLANAPPFTKLEVDVLSIESMVLLARHVLGQTDTGEEA